MKQITFPLLCCVPAILVAAQYKPVDSKSTVKFTIKNFGIGVAGTFTGVEGEIIFDPKALADAYFNVSVRSKTVNTGNDLRDNHLQGEGYFDAVHYPRISFESNKVSITPGKGTYMMFGKLTLKNNTEDVSFPFTVKPSGDGCLFAGTFTINRRNFGVGGFSTISENSEITLSVFAHK